MKRILDIVLSATGLVVLSPFLFLVAVLVKIDSQGPVFFRQERIGRHGRPFRIFKFRTMVADAGGKGSLVTVAGDVRVTRAGRFLRRYKIDELPQLINVLRGDMSLVGPRPEVERYVQLFEEEYRRLLSVRPGITDPASLRYSDEEGVLASSSAWEDEYVRRILPEKIRLSMGYVENQSIFLDLKLIFQTIFRSARPQAR